MRQTAWFHRTNRGGASLPASANTSLKATYEQWVKKYGEDQAKYLLEEMSRWTDSYSHGTLIDFDFVKTPQAARGGAEYLQGAGLGYDEIRAISVLFHKLLEGEWPI